MDERDGYLREVSGGESRCKPKDKATARQRWRKGESGLVLGWKREDKSAG